MHPVVAEFIGTAVLVIFGNGVVANVVLSRTKGSNSGWIVITAGWAIGVFVGVFCAQSYSGAHLNPAVTLSMAAAGLFAWSKVAGYILAQLAGGIVGGCLVFFFYREHFKITDDAGAKLACFCTAPNIRNIPQAFFCEALGTFLLILPIFLMTPAEFRIPLPTGMDHHVMLGLGTLGALPVALLVFGIGLSLGGATGYAINPARDFGPRLAHTFLRVSGESGSDWGYAWVPVAGPIVGAGVAALVYSLLH